MTFSTAWDRGSVLDRPQWFRRDPSSWKARRRWGYTWGVASRDKKRKHKRQRKRDQKRRKLERHPPRLGHETMLAIPAFRTAATALVTRLRGSGPPVGRVLRESDLQCPEVDSLIQGRYSLVRHLHGWSHEDAVLELHQLCTHLTCAVNHELCGRKTFWVAGELADALQRTNLDIAGDVLKLPFTSCAFVFNDAATLERIQTLVDAHVSQPRRRFRTLTVYVFPSGEEVETGFEFVFLADAYDGEWPYMISRSVPTEGKRNLDEILRSHPDGSTDALFRAAEMCDLLHLTINAVLYTTCGDFRCEVRGPAPPALRRTLQPRRDELSGEEVFYLPGRILVGASPNETTRTRKPPRHVIQKRFWVRGHWRRPNPSWHDQRLRWIAPFLKGPELTAIIEKEYELRGPEPPNGLPSPPGPPADSDQAR